MEGYLSALIIVGFDFAPRGWAFCSGQILPISGNTALFSLLGTTFGGNGTTTFALPDLRGRVPAGVGQGPGLSNYFLGQANGTENTTIISSQIPQHNHLFGVINAAANSNIPANTLFAAATDVNLEATKIYSTVAPNTILQGTTIASAGGNQPHTNIQPYLTLNYCICLSGIFPSRN